VNDVEAFAQLTKMMISTIEGLAKMVPRWRDPVERKTGRCRDCLAVGASSRRAATISL
jgi:hypothetical protein